MDNELREGEVQETAGRKDNAMLPASIIIAAVLISGAWIYSTSKNSPVLPSGPGPVAPGAEARMAVVGVDDHILGNPNADIFIVEYSDLECPYCKVFHPTMKQVMAEYGGDGKVAWVYRHFPLSIHPKAAREAEASECAAELGGNEAFWRYIDRVFSVTPSNNGLDFNALPTIAEDIGLDRARFEACLAAGTEKQNVERHALDAQNAGAEGTPHSVIVTKDGRELARINGAEQIISIRAKLDALLR